ncbi:MULTISPECIES: CBS domain-containing protein [Clostridium]|uniref:CBS domain-containing protein n=1 Tax=Clostridium TaxID=1485 RepID=UPI0008260113|nr:MULTISPECIES: CBS domain-containing protein [Clostridium]PJI09001.1 CBS domain-containing protein [Clostridium sp. CT7]
MNIAFFITPKKQIVYAKLTSTLRQALERMKYYNCNELIILNSKGEYAGFINREDIIRKIKNSPNLHFKDFNKVGILDIIKHVINNPLGINCDIEDIAFPVTNVNFLPVADDNNKFIGIIKKDDILNHKSCYAV